MTYFRKRQYNKQSDVKKILGMTLYYSKWNYRIIKGTMCCFDVRKMNKNDKDIFENVIPNLRL